jgi:hypothetical protein
MFISTNRFDLFLQMAHHMWESNSEPNQVHVEVGFANDVTRGSPLILASRFFRLAKSLCNQCTGMWKQKNFRHSCDFVQLKVDVFCDFLCCQCAWISDDVVSISALDRELNNLVAVINWNIWVRDRFYLTPMTWQQAFTLLQRRENLSLTLYSEWQRCCGNPWDHTLFKCLFCMKKIFVSKARLSVRVMFSKSVY